MSDAILNNSNSTSKEKDKEKENEKTKEKEQSDTDEENNLLPFLSKDLFNQINSIDDIEKDDINYSEDKFTNTILKDSDKHNVQDELDDADLIHEENENEIDYNTFNIGKSKTNEIQKIVKENYRENDKTQETDSMPRVLSEQLVQPNFNHKFALSEKGNSALNLGRYSGRTDSINSNNMQNNLNFINNSFSKNGRSGWICSACQNFNYESKNLIYFIYFLIYC